MLVINICIDNIYTYAHMCIGYTMAYKVLHDLTCPLAPCHDPSDSSLPKFYSTYTGHLAF